MSYYKIKSKKEFLTRFMPLARRHGLSEVWTDFVQANRNALEYAMQPDKGGATVKELNRIRNKYQAEELMEMADLIKYIGDCAESAPYEDVFGEIYMELGLADKRRKDFYTPWDVARLIAAQSLQDAKELVAEKGWISVADFCCGSGSLLLAFAHECWENGIDPTSQVLFMAQDISFTAVSMCYIQMSVQCLPGFVVQGDALSQPITGSVLFPKSANGAKILETHTLHKSTWYWRRVLSMVREADITLGDTAV